MPTRVSLPRFRFFFGPVTRFTVNITYALSFAFIMRRETSAARIYVMRSWILYTLRVFGLILIFQIRASSPNFMPQCEAKTPPFYGRFRPRWYTVDVVKRLPSRGRSRVRFWTVTSLEDICKEPPGGERYSRDFLATVGSRWVICILLLWHAVCVSPGRSHILFVGLRVSLSFRCASEDSSAWSIAAGNCQLSLLTNPFHLPSRN